MKVWLGTVRPRPATSGRWRAMIGPGAAETRRGWSMPTRRAGAASILRSCSQSIAASCSATAMPLTRSCRRTGSQSPSARSHLRRDFFKIAERGDAAPWRRALQASQSDRRARCTRRSSACSPRPACGSRSIGPAAGRRDRGWLVIERRSSRRAGSCRCTRRHGGPSLDMFTRRSAAALMAMLSTAGRRPNYAE